MGPNHYTLEKGGATCSACGNLNPLANLRRFSLSEVTGAYEIIVNFGPDTHKKHAMKVQGLHLDCRTVLSIWRSVASEELLVRMLVYLGATEDQIADYHASRRQWGQGSMHCRLLFNRKNLLGINYSLL